MSPVNCTVAGFEVANGFL